MNRQIIKEEIKRTKKCGIKYQAELKGKYKQNYKLSLFASKTDKKYKLVRQTLLVAYPTASFLANRTLDLFSHPSSSSGFIFLGPVQSHPSWEEL